VTRSTARSTARLTAGIVIGTLLTATIAVAGRRLEQRAGSHLLDWATIRSIARRRVGDRTGRLTAAERARAEAFYLTAAERVAPLVAAEIGSPAIALEPRRRSLTASSGSTSTSRPSNGSSVDWRPSWPAPEGVLVAPDLPSPGS
jgi:hypothetical protein